MIRKTVSPETVFLAILNNICYIYVAKPIEYKDFSGIRDHYTCF